MKSLISEVSKQAQKVLAHANGLEKNYIHVKAQQEIGVGPTETDMEDLTKSADALASEAIVLQQEIEQYKKLLS